MHEDLKILRKQLDNVDKGMMDLITKRFEITRKIGQYKKDNDMPAFAPARELEIYQRLKDKAIENGIEPKVFIEVWKTIITQVKVEHEEIKNKV